MRQRTGWRGWIARSVLTGGVIALASGLAICMNADWSAPPRFDGAGYALLARALLSGEGYRAIDHPDRPRHVHFPPGYPLTLALTWSITGTSVAAAHLASTIFTIAAAVAAWCWFRRLMPGPAADVLGLALAVNWLWARTGSLIQSEPLYLLLGQLSILAAARAGQRNVATARETVLLGVLLAASLLTRPVAIGLSIAILFDLASRGQWVQAVSVAVLASFLVAPWLAWIAAAGAGGATHLELLTQAGTSLVERITHHLVFYIQRLPDQITGPFVEVGTSPLSPLSVAIAANVWAVLCAAVIGAGWASALCRRRGRLAGLIPLVTFGILLPWPYTEAGRFLIPLVPCILVGAIEGIAEIARLAGRFAAFRASRRRLYASCVVLAASMPYPVYMTAAGRTHAQEASHREFDAACDWLAEHARRPGPVLSRHPGEVFWRTGRPGLEVASAERPGERDAGPDSIARTIDTYHVAYILVDQDRYIRAPKGPLTRFVAQHPERVRKVWGWGPVSLYEVNSAH